MTEEPLEAVTADRAADRAAGGVLRLSCLESVFSGLFPRWSGHGPTGHLASYQEGCSITVPEERKFADLSLAEPGPRRWARAPGPLGVDRGDEWAKGFGVILYCERCSRRDPRREKKHTFYYLEAMTITCT